LTPQPLAQRLLAGPLSELGDELFVVARLEVGGNPPFQGLQTKFLQAVSRSSEWSITREIRQRRPSPLLQGSSI
jgi:hypothetical protein